jgi:hypothetical protein
MLVLALNTGCEQSRNREIAQGFVAQFERILEQRKTLDKLEEQGKQYDQQLDKDLRESNTTKRVKALGVWVGEYKGMLSQARSVSDAQSTIIDTLVSDSAKLSGDAGKYAREAIDSLRDDVSLQKRELDIVEQMIALVESYIGDPGSADLKQLEEFTKTLDDLDAKEKQAFQRAQDAIVRLRAAAGLT